MSAKKTSTQMVREALGVDFYTKVEVVLGVNSNSAHGHWGIDNMPASAGKKITWERSPNYPAGVTWMTIPTGLQEDGRVPIGDDLAVKLFDKTIPESPRASNGVLLLKVVADIKSASDYFVVPARFRNKNLANDISVYGLDRLDERNGGNQVVYTIPVHNLEEGKRKFFFLVVMKRFLDKPDKLNLIVHKIGISRGRNYFRIQRTDFFHAHAKISKLVEAASAEPLIVDMDWPTINRLFQETVISNKIATVSRY